MLDDDVLFVWTSLASLPFPCQIPARLSISDVDFYDLPLYHSYVLPKDCILLYFTNIYSFMCLLYSTSSSAECASEPQA
jgi:hypothetical protein